MPDIRKQQLHILRGRFQKSDIEHRAKHLGTPLLLIDKKRIIDGYQQLLELMPRVTPFFAMKSCPHPEVIKVLQTIGAHIDVATVGEIKILKTLQYDSQLLIHTQPHLKPQDIAIAVDYGITSYVVDGFDQLARLEPFKAQVELAIRLSFPNARAVQNLSYKFGLVPSEALDLLQDARAKGFKVTTICFHVGSQVDDPSIFAGALRETYAFCQQAKQLYNHNFEILDIGGGFPAIYTEPVTPIEEFATVINPLLDELFADYQIRSQPGRYLINPCITAISSVVSTSNRSGRDWLFIDDGVYGTFSDIISGHSKYLMYGLDELDQDLALKPYIIGGPTCDSIDVVDEAMLLPTLQSGDMVVAPNLGAYSWALTTEFNSLAKPHVVVI